VQSSFVAGVFACETICQKGHADSAFNINELSLLWHEIDLGQLIATNGHEKEPHRRYINTWR